MSTGMSSVMVAPTLPSNPLASVMPRKWWLAFNFSSTPSTITHIRDFLSLYSACITQDKTLTELDDQEAFDWVKSKFRLTHIHLPVAAPGNDIMIYQQLTAIVGNFLDKPTSTVAEKARMKRVRNNLLDILHTILARIVHFRLTTKRRNLTPAVHLQLKEFVSGVCRFGLSINVNPVDVAINESWKDLAQKMNDGYIDRITRPIITSVRSLYDHLLKDRPYRNGTTVSKTIEAEDIEVGKLRKLRSRLQRAFEKDDISREVSLHLSPTHLFSPATYTDLDREIDSVLAAGNKEREHVVVLLQKSFELKALHELEMVLHRALRCYIKIADKFDENRHMDILENLIELAWLQRKTWDARPANVEVDVGNMLECIYTIVGFPLGLDPTLDTFRTSRENLERQKTAKILPAGSIHDVYNVMLVPESDKRAKLRGGDGGPTEDPFNAATVPTSPIHSKIVTQRDVIRRLIRELNLNIAKVERRAAVAGDKMKCFADNVLLPFLQPITRQWEMNLHYYLRPMPGAPDIDRPLSGATAGLVVDVMAMRSRVAPPTLQRSMANLSAGNMLLLQAIKAARFFIQIGAAFVAQKVFNESYIRKVFAEGRDPPPLTSMLYLMASIDATAHLLIVVVLVLSSFAFKTDLNTFIVDDILLGDLLTEFAVSSLVFIIIGMLMADILRRKRYFQYADQGQVVSSAYRSVLLSLCAVNFVVPYSMLIS